MSYPPILPPIAGTPPFVPVPQVIIPTPMAPSTMPQTMTAAADTGPYVPGPFCFGLDGLICGTISADANIFGYPIRRFCLALTNTLCAVLVLIVLGVLLGISVNSLLQ